MNNQRIVVSLNLKRTIKIMKLTVLMLAVCLSSVVASTYAQTATLNVSAKNETLEKVSEPGLLSLMIPVMVSPNVSCNWKGKPILK